MPATTNLVLLRHGESVSVREKKFSGWDDVPLSDRGLLQAERAAQALLRSSMVFEQVYTSYLMRAADSLKPIAEALKLDDHLISREWRLNERHYGILQGQYRHDTVIRYGADAIISWRRDYRTRPPEMPVVHPGHPSKDPKYSHIPIDMLPSTESLEDAAIRIEPWWEEFAKKDLMAGKNVLVVAHTASIRGITRIVENLNDEQAAAFRIPTASPVVYKLTPELDVVAKYRVDRSISEVWRRFLSKIKPVRRVAWK